jgi:nucleotide-binding universal stress UspA family protein
MTTMFKNVLVGVDGSANGRDAIALAGHLTGPGGKLTLANVRDGQLHPNHAITPGMLEEEREASAALLEDEREVAGVDAELVSVVAYSAGRGLHEQAEEQGADLIVVGSCSHHGIVGRTMLGDDTRAALNGAPCAVAIAPGGYAAHPVQLRRIGVAYNQSPESKQALQTARELAVISDGTIAALEVVVIPTVLYTGLIPPLVGAGVESALQESLARMKAMPDVQGRAVYGVTGEELAEFGDELDLLVVGSRGYGPVKRLVLGSTSTYLERYARCALLVLPRGAAVEPKDDASAEAQRSEPVGASA